MTAPDHTPYLLPTDLRTPYVAVVEIIAASDEPGAYTKAEARAIRRACVDMLRRLDRERRQACRRGALAMWRRGSRHPRKFPGSQCEVCAEYRAQALAFRAAARAK